MNIVAEHLHLYKRNATLIFVIALITTASTLGFLQTQEQHNYEATLFMSIGIQQGPSSSSYEDFQAADQFTETVQGWFKNPEILRSIESQINYIPSLHARKQEKQNIVVTFSAPSQTAAEQTGQAIVSELNTSISSYNRATNHNFQLALTSIDIIMIGNRVSLFLAIAFIGGIILGIALAYAREQLFGVVSFTHQAELTLAKKADQLVSFKNLTNKKQPYIEARLTQLRGKKTNLVAVNMPTQKIANNLKKHIASVTFKVHTFPHDAVDITQHGKNSLVLIVKLGKTRLQDLSQLTALLPSEYLLIIAL